MKSIELSSNTEHQTREVLKIVMEQGSALGMNIGDMRKRMAIIDKLERANGVLELEDADWQILKDIYAQHPWRIAHKDLLAIADAIENAKSS